MADRADPVRVDGEPADRAPVAGGGEPVDHEAQVGRPGAGGRRAEVRVGALPPADQAGFDPPARELHQGLVGVVDGGHRVAPGGEFLAERGEGGPAQAEAGGEQDQRMAPRGGVGPGHGAGAHPGRFGGAVQGGGQLR